MLKDLILDILIDPLKGTQISAYLALALIVALVYLLLRSFTQILFKWPEIYEKMFLNRKKMLNIAKEQADQYINERRDAMILEDEEFKEGIRENIRKELNKAIFEQMEKIYSRLSTMREEYAGKMATKAELASLQKELNELAKELANLKGKLDMN